MAAKILSGKIARLNRAGFGIITTEDQSASSEEFAFPFAKLQKRRFSGVTPYRGESMKEFGLSEGTSVTFAESTNGQVDFVELP